MTMPIQVSNAFIERYGQQSPLTHMKLQKLVFYANGWNLGITRRPLVNERAQVWRYGPVFRSLYDALTGYGNQRIDQPSRLNPFSNEIPTVPRNNTPDSQIIDWVWQRYGGFSAAALSDQTHAPGTPWRLIAEQHNFAVPFNTDIPDELVEAYFSRLAQTEGIITA